LIHQRRTTVPISVSHPPALLTEPAGEEVILGVDTHKDVHVAAVITLIGGLLETRSFATTTVGYTQLLAWAMSFGTLRRAGIECTGSYGAALTRHLQAQGIGVLEVNQPDKADRRRRGKTDMVDAEAAARAVLAGRAAGPAKAGTGAVEMLRVFKMAKNSAVKSRSQAINQLKSVIVTADTRLRESLAGLTNTHLIRRCARLTDARHTGPEAAARHTLRLLARRIQNLSEEIDDLNARIGEAVEVAAPGITEVQGVGPDSAASLLIAGGDNPERLASEASYAALCGVTPVEASSGQTQRRRLNRGGDRQANAALYRIVLSRLRWDTRTQEYFAKRVAEGKTRREIIRCLKRYVARELYCFIRLQPVDKDVPIAA
jgi:transposase